MKLVRFCAVALVVIPTIAFGAENTTTPRQGVSNSNTVGNPTYNGQKTDRIYNQVAPTAPRSNYQPNRPANNKCEHSKSLGC